MLLIGAGGGVGSAAAQIARRLGARVIGVDRHAPHPDAPIHAIAEKLIIGAEDLPAEIRAATGGKGADVVFDLVGGVMFRSAVNCLALRGRLIEIAVTGQREVSFDLADFYHNESRLFGVDTLKRDLTASAEVLDALTPGIHRRRLPCRADRRDLRAGRGARGLPQGRGRRSRAASCCGRRNREAAMIGYLVSLVMGLAVGVAYGSLQIRSPAPPLIALVGLLGMVLGEQAVDMAKRHFVPPEPVSIQQVPGDVEMSD